MKSSVNYISVGSAIRAREAEFLSAVESAVHEWLESSDTDDIHDAIFDYTPTSCVELKKAA